MSTTTWRRVAVSRFSHWLTRQSHALMMMMMMMTVVACCHVVCWALRSLDVASLARSLARWRVVTTKQLAARWRWRQASQRSSHVKCLTVLTMLIIFTILPAVIISNNNSRVLQSQLRTQQTLGSDFISRNWNSNWNWNCSTSQSFSMYSFVTRPWTFDYGNFNLLCLIIIIIIIINMSRGDYLSLLGP